MVADHHFHSTNEAEFGYGQLLAIAWRRRFWFLATFSTVVIAAGFVTVRTEPTYESSMQLLVEPNYQAREKLTEVEGQSQTSEQDYATQLNLMRSSRFFEAVIDDLAAKYPDLSIGHVRGSLQLSQLVEDETNTRIFEVVYTDNDPIKTQQILESLKTAYQNYNLEQQEARLTQGLAFIDEQLATVRRSLNSSQGELEQFRQGENLIDPAREAERISEALGQVKRQQESLQAQYADVNNRSMELQRQLSLRPQEALIVSRLSQSSLFQTLLGELQATEVELSKQRAIYTDSAPEVQVLLDQRQEQLGLLQQEIQRILGSDASQLPSRALLSQGRLSQIDLQLANQLVDAQTTIEGLEAQLRSLSTTEQQLRAELNQFPRLLAQNDRLQPEAETTQKILQQLLEDREKLSAELAGGGFNWQVVEPPQEGEKIAPNPRQNILLGAVVGIFLGGVAAFLREAADRVVHTSEDLKKQAALPLLGSLPEFLPKPNRFPIQLPLMPAQSSSSVTEQAMQWQPFRESLDLIYKNIQLLHESERSRSLVVTSALPDEGKSTLIIGLALSAARSSERVLVIDADLRQPVLHERLNVSNQYGLSTLLETARGPFLPQSVTLSDASFDLLPAGPEPIDPVRLLNSQRFKTMLRFLQNRYDLILIDTPPVLGMVDAMQAASVCHGIVMVGRLDRVTQEELKQAAAMLSSLNVLGIVANGGKRTPFSDSQNANRNHRAGDQDISAA
ncbi:GumC family protein [Thermocoleostomius sinensis]|uniref:non-specific protein-tyrosine kinase n=1 Tax=Thermocoleostomius sinensis A174 TaxID=2016057 RepID=A0A9E8Z8D6_9CYAN|nr:polysaccharide biosynthesis tyrosine autokinase [Thermocoleostomius sinensis]WAL58375.1 polysaccharide biosynthesis tyrosine autokinase [Thermocoleostomius sinensis A174]